MKFMLSWTLAPENRDEVLRRLKAGKEAGTEGITVLGEWHDVNLLGGWAVVEADSEEHLAGFMLLWTDVSETMVSVVTDADVLRKLT